MKYLLVGVLFLVVGIVAAQESAVTLSKKELEQKVSKLTGDDVIWVKRTINLADNPQLDSIFIDRFTYAMVGEAIVDGYSEPEALHKIDDREYGGFDSNYWKEVLSEFVIYEAYFVERKGKWVNSKMQWLCFVDKKVGKVYLPNTQLWYLMNEVTLRQDGHPYDCYKMFNKHRYNSTIEIVSGSYK